MNLGISQLLEKLEGCENAVPIGFAGGANNRVFRVEGISGKSFLIKEYFYTEGDLRNRFQTEKAFYHYAWEIAGVRMIPQPLLWDETHRLAAFEFIEESSLRDRAIASAKIDTAIDFIAQLNAYRFHAVAQALPPASEACFTMEQHFATVDSRLARLATMSVCDAHDQEAWEFLHKEILPAWAELQKQQANFSSTSRQIEPDRCISPSDFGFHNAKQRENEHWVFFDFEYAGWDDPAKLVCDFFCQPAQPVPMEFFSYFAEQIATHLGSQSVSNFSSRCQELLPVYRIKWCCILLNEFLTTESARRNFSGNINSSERKHAQLQKSRHCLNSLKNFP